MEINDTYIKTVPRLSLGYRGEDYIKKVLIDKEYVIYKTNLRKWGVEMDIIAYKFDARENVLEIRAVEVKTRSGNRKVQLAELHLREKIYRYRHMLYSLGSEIQSLLIHRGYLQKETYVYIKYSLDLAIVLYRKENNSFYIQDYIRDINLLM